MVFSSGAYYHAGSVGIRSNTRKYPWTSALLAHMVRACTHTNFSTVSLLHNVNMAAHVDKYNQPGSPNVLVPLSPFRRGNFGLEFDPLTKHATCPWKDASNDDYNHSIRVKSMALADSHSLACDMAIQHTEITAYSLLEVTHDLRMLVHLAQTNKATWLRCSQVLTSTSTECKILSNAPWHKRAGRAVEGNHAETPIDIKMYLFNKRMHTWYHHELSYQQYMDLESLSLLFPVSRHSHVVSVAVLETMDAVAPTTPPSTSSSFDYSDEGGHDAAEQVLTNAILLKVILKFHTELRVRMVAVSVEDTPLTRRANQAVQGAMDAIVQQHPQAHHTTVIRDYRPQHTLIEKLVSPDIVYSLLLTSIQVRCERVFSTAEAETLHGKPILPASQADILSLRVGEY
ncbi:unnamed protein product, partial [Symbiodinium necroappetens]